MISMLSKEKIRKYHQITKYALITGACLLVLDKTLHKLLD